MLTYCVQWEYEDDLPKMIDEEFNLIFEKSQLFDGIRMYPYVWVTDDEGYSKKAFLA